MARSFLTHTAALAGLGPNRELQKLMPPFTLHTVLLLVLVSCRKIMMKLLEFALKLVYTRLPMLICRQLTKIHIRPNDIDEIDFWSRVHKKERQKDLVKESVGNWPREL